jgi:hypothetical protein
MIRRPLRRQGKPAPLAARARCGAHVTGGRRAPPGACDGLLVKDRLA